MYMPKETATAGYAYEGIECWIWPTAYSSDDRSQAASRALAHLNSAAEYGQTPDPSLVQFMRRNAGYSPEVRDYFANLEAEGRHIAGGIDRAGRTIDGIDAAGRTVDRLGGAVDALGRPIDEAGRVVNGGVDSFNRGVNGGVDSFNRGVNELGAAGGRTINEINRGLRPLRDSHRRIPQRRFSLVDRP